MVGPKRSAMPTLPQQGKNPFPTDTRDHGIPKLEPSYWRFKRWIFAVFRNARWFYWGTPRILIPRSRPPVSRRVLDAMTTAPGLASVSASARDRRPWGIGAVEASW